MSQDEAETEEQEESWSAVLLEKLSEYPAPTSPLHVRLAYGTFLALIMPVLWPMIMGLMFAVFCLAFTVIGVMLLLSPVWVAIFGIQKETTERLEVEVDKDKVSVVTDAVRGVGGKVSRR